MKKLKFIIVLLIIVIVLIIIAIINLNKRVKRDDQIALQNQVQQIDITDEPIYSKTFKQVSNRDDYFAIKNIIENFYYSIQDINSDTIIRTEKNKDINPVELRKKGISKLLNMLDIGYKSKFNTNEEALINYALKYRYNQNYYNIINYDIIINRLYVKALSDTNLLFLANFKANNIQSELLIKLDMYNDTFSIFLQDYIEKFNYSIQMTEQEISIKDNNIAENDSNLFNYNSISDLEMAKEYFKLYKVNILENKKEMYYNLLNEEYKKKRFYRETMFNEYVDFRKDIIKKSELVKFTTDILDDDTVIFYLIDNNNNCILIEIKDDVVLDYKIKLDDYTIPSQEYIEKYNNASEKEKVLANVQTFFKMLNNKDYYSAYNVLDNNFKDNNFKTLDEFKQYAQTQFFNQNVLKTSENFKKVGTYYSVAINYAESDEENARMFQKNFIVALGQGTEFKLSFNK